MSITLSLIPALLLVVLASGVQADGRSLPGRVLRVVDGDSLVLDVRGSQYRIDLAGIDAPELNQPWGPAAGERLRRLLAGAFVVVEVQGGEGTALSGGIRLRNRDPALQLLEEGLAWSLFRESAGGDSADDRPNPYLAAEQAARAARLGLWSEPMPIPPWEWRRARIERGPLMPLPTTDIPPSPGFRPVPR